MTRILIADDSPPVRQGVRNLLKAHADWEVCGEAVDGQDAIAKSRQLAPDVIVDGLRDAYYGRHRSGTENIERRSNHFNPTFFDVHGLPACHSRTPCWYLSGAIEKQRGAGCEGH
jgi:DNA-binding NarL/FixJ family response regulator